MDAKRKPGGRALLGEILLERGLITQEQLDQALRIQVVGMRRLGSILVRMKVLTEDSLTDALSVQSGQSVLTVDEECRGDVERVLPRYLCRKYSVIPLSLEKNNVLRLAMADPLDGVAISDVENYTKKVVQPVLARLSDIERAIPAHVAFSLHDLFNPLVYRSVAGVAVSALLVLLVIFGFRLYKDVRIQREGTESLVGDSVIYQNRDLMVGVNKDGTVNFGGRGAHSDGYYGVRFDDTAHLISFVKGEERQLSTEQFAWLAWVFQEKLKVAEPLVVAARP